MNVTIAALVTSYLEHNNKTFDPLFGIFRIGEDIICLVSEN